MTVAVNPARRSLDALVAKRDAMRKQFSELPGQIRDVQNEIDERTTPPLMFGRHITARQREVLSLVMQEMSNKQIGKLLNITERTVKFHVSEMLARFGLTGFTRHELVQQCRSVGVIGE